MKNTSNINFIESSLCAFSSTSLNTYNRFFSEFFDTPVKNRQNFVRNFVKCCGICNFRDNRSRPDDLDRFRRTEQNYVFESTTSPIVSEIFTVKVDDFLTKKKFVHRYSLQFFSHKLL